MKSLRFLALLFATTAYADPPVASYIFPAGGQRGTTVDVKVGGLNLHSRCGFELLGPGVAFERQLKRTPTLFFEGPVLPLPESQQQEDYPKDMAGKISIDAKAALGVRPGRVWTSQGAASGLAFEIGELPEIVEQESDGPCVPTKVTLPVTINGRIYPREDIDEWSFSARKGQTVTATAISGRLGLPLEPFLEIRDSRDRRLAENDIHPGDSDARITFAIPADGEYRLRIHDARMLGGPAYVYRLTITTDVAPAPQLTMKSDAAMPLSSVIRSQILAGKSDGWSFALKKGQTYEIDLKAIRIHSPLIPVVVIRDPAGKELQRFDLAQQSADPTLRLTAAVDGIHKIEISERFRARGGAAFLYELDVKPAKNVPDFRLTLVSDSITLPREGKAVVKLTVERTGDFKGPIEISVDGLPPGVAASKATIGAGQNAIDLTLTCAPSAKIEAKPISLHGTAKIGDKVVVRKAVVSAKKWSPEIDSPLLAVAIPTPFVVKADYLLTQAPRGTVFPRRYAIDRKGFAGPITISLADRQARHLQGASGPTIVIPPNKSEFEYPMAMPPWMETGRTCRVCIMATAEVKDKDGSLHEVSFSSVEQNMQIIVVVEPGRLGLELERTSLRIEAGGTAKLGVRVKRGDKLNGPAKVELVAATDVRADAITIPADQERGELTLRLASNLVSSNKVVVVRATITDAGRPVTAEASVELVRD